MPDAVLLKCFCVNPTTEAQETLPRSYTSFQFFGAQHNLLSFQNRLSGPKGVREDYFVKMKWMHLGKLLEKSKKVVCCLRTGLQNDLVKARGSSPGLSAELRLWQLTARSWALQRPVGLFAHNTRTCDGASVSSCVCVHADAVCNTSSLIASMNVSCLWCLNVTHVIDCT